MHAGAGAGAGGACAAGAGAGGWWSVVIVVRTPNAPDSVCWLCSGTAVCGKEFVVSDDDQKKFRLEGHCFSCSADYRAVLRKSSSPEIKSGFLELRTKDPDQYRKLALHFKLYGLYILGFDARCMLVE